MIEIWRDIKGFEELYQVSNFGRIKSLEKYVKCNGGSFRIKKEQILKPGKSKTGYLNVVLRKNNISYTYYVHRLVAEAFLPNPNNWLYINHKDENKHNNKANNLEWCTKKYNTNYGNAQQNRLASWSRNRRRFYLEIHK